MFSFNRESLVHSFIHLHQIHSLPTVWYVIRDFNFHVVMAMRFSFTTLCPEIFLTIILSLLLRLFVMLMMMMIMVISINARFNCNLPPFGWILLFFCVTQICTLHGAIYTHLNLDLIFPEVCCSIFFFFKLTHIIQ